MRLITNLIVPPAWLIAIVVVLAALLGCDSRPKEKPDTAVAPVPEASAAVAEFEGIRIHYTSFGEGPRAVVFIHGWTCDGSFWRLQEPEFGAFRRVIVLDLPGHGRSDAPEREYHPPFFADSVAAVLKHAGVEQAVVVGHSMGYAVSRHFVLRHADMALGLVSVDGYAQRVPQDPAERETWKRRTVEWANELFGPDGREKRRRFVESMFVDATTPEVRAEILSKMQRTAEHVAQSALHGMMNPDVWCEDRVDVPALFVFAKSEQLPEDTEQFLAGLFSRLRFEVWDGVGHFLMLEEPARLNRTLREFVADVAADLVR